MQDFINNLSNEISKKYKIDEIELNKVIEKHLDKTPELRKLLTEDWKKIRKTGVFKDFRKKLKKDIYFSLRTYRRPDKDHVSSAERTEYLDTFLEQIHEFVASSESVLDVGGGMFPATFPFEKYPNIKDYTWIDKDNISYEKLKSFKAQKNFEQLNLYCEQIGERAWGHFDLVLMLKLIPVVNRQEKELLKFLADIPARTIIITGNKEAMVKKQGIKRREDIVLKRFIKLSDRRVTKEIDIDSEFGYVIV